MNKFEIIYANGDSYVAGDELGMKEFIPELSHTHYPGEIPMTAEEYKTILSKYPRIPWNDYQDACKLEAFPQTLGDMLNIPVINRAVGGSSNQSTCMAAIVDIEELLTRVSNTKIFAIIGLTSITRITNFSLRNTLMLTAACTSNDPFSNLIKYHVAHASDTYLFIDSLLNIIGLINYLEQKKISYILTDSGLWDSTLKLPVLQNWMSSIASIPQPCLTMLDELRGNESIYHVEGHFSKIIHDRFAKSIAEYIGRTYN